LCNSLSDYIIDVLLSPLYRYPINVKMLSPSDLARAARDRLLKEEALLMTAVDKYSQQLHEELRITIVEERFGRVESSVEVDRLNGVSNSINL
jgi:hypothetical protein